MRVDKESLVLTVEYTDLLILLNSAIRGYKFHSQGKMPEAVNIEIPELAWDTSSRESTKLCLIHVEGNPPENWFGPGKANPMKLTVNPPQKKMNTDEMSVVGKGQEVAITQNSGPRRGSRSDRTVEDFDDVTDDEDEMWGNSRGMSPEMIERRR